MAIMKSCCCFSDMKSACLAGGIYTIVIAALGLFGALYMGNGNRDYTSQTSPTWYVMIPVALVYAALLIAGITLIVGSRKGYRGRHLIMSFIVIMAIFLFICAGAMVAMIIMLAVSGKNFPPMMIVPLLIWVVQIIFMVLSFLSAISLHQQLREEGPDGPLSTPPKHVVTIVTAPGVYPPTGQNPDGNYPADEKCALGEMSQPPPYSPA